MEKPLNVVSMLSLQEMAVKQVAVNLWNEVDILAAIGAFSPTFRENYGDYSERWRKTIESKVIEKLLKLLLPTSFVKQLLSIITPIGLQILRWKRFHERYLKMSGWEVVDILTKLCWTTAGTVDHKKTAKQIIRCEMVDNAKQYKLACLYCLDDYIPVLWEELPEGIKSNFYCEGNSTSTEIKRLNLEFCFPYILKGEQSKLDDVIRREYGNRLPSVPVHLAHLNENAVPKYTLSFYRVAFEISVHRGNKAASEYFFQKLPYDEREVALDTAANVVVLLRFTPSLSCSVDPFPLANISDLLCYLLSQMNSKHRMKFFKKNPTELLILFMDWPWKDIFWKMADLMWASLPANFGNHVWNKMIAYIREQKYYFPVLNLFQEFFEHSPISFRKEFVDRECRLGDFIPALFGIQDSETIKVIFRNVDAADKVRLVSSNNILKLFFNSVLEGSMHMVEVCLQEAVLSTEDRDVLKEAFMAFWTADCQQPEKNRPIRNRFLQLLDKIGANTQRKLN